LVGGYKAYRNWVLQHFEKKYNFKTLLNLVSNQQVDYSNSVGIGGTVNFLVMDTITHNFIDSNSRFKLIQNVGSFITIANLPEKGINSNYQYNNNYELKIGIKFL
jgi:hypothetical protein